MRNASYILPSHLHFASFERIIFFMKAAHTENNSAEAPCCPIDFALKLCGDRWSLLLLRNMLLLGMRRYNEFINAPEGISTNILASRLRALQEADLISRHVDPTDRKSAIYLPTDRGLALLPVLIEILRWGHSQANNPQIPEEMAGVFEGKTSSLIKRIEQRVRSERATLAA